MMEVLLLPLLKSVCAYHTQNSVNINRSLLVASIVRCIVEKAGRIGSRVRVNLSEVPLNLPTVTSKDKEDLIMAAKEKVDMVVVSTTKYAETLNKVREILTGFCHRFAGTGACTGLFYRSWRKGHFNCGEN